MGQAGAQREPTMEEILASIRRIIENNEPGADGNPLGLGLADALQQLQRVHPEGVAVIVAGLALDLGGEVGALAAAGAHLVDAERDVVVVVAALGLVALGDAGLLLRLLAGDDLGLTLQTGFVTKALVGLFGSDRFRLAVSADGSTFFDGLSVDNATGIVDQPRLPRFKAWTNYDNYVGVGTWTKIGLNNTDTNDQGAFDAANNHFVAPADGTYLFGATLLYKINASATARMRGRLVLNGTTEIRGSLGEISATHVSLATAIWLQTMVPLTAGDTVELQGYFRVADGYFAADHTSFWGCKID